MFSKYWRNKNISAYSSKDFNYDSFNEAPVTEDDGLVVIWYDTSINKNEQDDQYSMSQLRLVNNSIFIFTNEQQCLEFINKFNKKKKLFLIVSGSLGKSFVPKICDYLQIYSIYIFCGKKINHESWAEKYKKIKGVFDNVTELCEDLQRDKQKFEIWRKFIDSLSKTNSLPHQFNELFNFKNSKHDDHQQPKDDIKIMIPSADVPFSKEKPSSPIQDMEINNNIHPSETVAPYMQYKQQMEFSDTGIWPCVTVVDNDRNQFVNHLHSTIESVKHFYSIENVLQHIHDHPVDPHFIVVRNPINIEYLSLLLHPRVRRIYIYCSNNRLNEYDAWSESYSHIVSVLQHVDTLTRLILWDLSACIVDIGNYYDAKNQRDLSQARYRYAYRLHVIIQGHLNNRMEMIEYSQSAKLNN